MRTKFSLLILWFTSRKEYNEYHRRKQLANSIHRLKNHVGRSEDIRIVLREAK